MTREKKVRRKAKGDKDRNVFMEVLYWIPELLLIPLRLLFFLGRSIIRIIFD